MDYSLISVIVPVYNVETYLCKCVDSLLNQDYPKYEILLVDDGSMDSCPSICDEYSKNYNCVRTFHKDNGGLSDARNYGTKNAQGDWIVFVDSDDYVSTDYLSSLWSLKEKYNADIAMAWVIRVNEEGKLLGRKLSFPDFCISGEEAVLEIYEKGIHVGWNAYNKLYPKSVLITIPFPNGYYEDMACMYKIMECCNKVAIGDFNQNYCYVQRPNSILNSKLSEKHFHIFDICDDFINYFLQKYPKHRVLKPIIYAKATIQMLHSQIMDRNSFKNVFLRNVKLFRKNILKVLFAQGVNPKFKISFLLLCSYSSLYRKIRHIKLNTNINI